MKAKEFIYRAIENLESQTNIKAEWQSAKIPELDGKLIIWLDGQKLLFNAEAKVELRDHQLAAIERLAEAYPPLIVIANRIFPKIKEKLREQNVAYLEVNGNVFLKQKGIYIWTDTQKTPHRTVENRNRAFTKTGLRVVFQILLDKEFITLPYREMAERLAIGLGNINYVIKGLKELGFLILLGKNRYQLQNTKELLDRWIIAYKEKLQPDLLIGRFAFVEERYFLNWQNLAIDFNRTKWGGEPAGNILTNYLQPGTLIMYTTETRMEIIKHYRLVPDDDGPVIVYRKFWDIVPGNETTVPPLLVYADLAATGDRRMMETAEKIYNEYIQDKL